MGSAAAGGAGRLRAGHVAFERVPGVDDGGVNGDGSDDSGDGGGDFGAGDIDAFAVAPITGGAPPGAIGGCSRRLAVAVAPGTCRREISRQVHLDFTAANHASTLPIQLRSCQSLTTAPLKLRR